MEGTQNNEEPGIHILTDDFLPQDTSNTPSFAPIPGYTGKEQDTDRDNDLEIYLNVSELLSLT